jgi:hypothetical protein
VREGRRTCMRVCNTGVLCGQLMLPPLLMPDGPAVCDGEGDGSIIGPAPERDG